MTQQINDVDAYIADHPVDIQKKLQEMRAIIKAALPEDVEEKISYGMPGYRTTKFVVYFGAAKNHLGLYPASTAAMETFKDELSAYKTTKGSIHFPYTEDLPKALIEAIIAFRLEELSQK